MKFLLKEQEIFENIPEFIIRPLNEITQIRESIHQICEVEISKEVLNSLEPHPRLNTKIWNNFEINPSVSNKLLDVADNFIQQLELPKELKILDILLLGSLAGYNWSEYSDLDLHILLDYTKLKEKTTWTKKHMDAEKNLFNLNHDIIIKNFPVEVYVQDLKEPNAAEGVYSLKKNKWLQMPEKYIKDVNLRQIEKKAEVLLDKIEHLQKLKTQNKWEQLFKQTTKLKDKLKAMRKSGLSKEGELSQENLVYKILRRTSSMDILDELYYVSQDEINSL